MTTSTSVVPRAISLWDDDKDELTEDKSELEDSAAEHLFVNAGKQEDGYDKLTCPEHTGLWPMSHKLSLKYTYMYCVQQIKRSEVGLLF